MKLLFKSNLMNEQLKSGKVLEQRAEWEEWERRHDEWYECFYSMGEKMDSDVRELKEIAKMWACRLNDIGMPYKEQAVRNVESEVRVIGRLSAEASCHSRKLLSVMNKMQERMEKVTGEIYCSIVSNDKNAVE